MRLRTWDLQIRHDNGEAVQIRDLAACLRVLAHELDELRVKSVGVGAAEISYTGGQVQIALPLQGMAGEIRFLQVLVQVMERFSMKASKTRPVSV